MNRNKTITAQVLNGLAQPHLQLGLQLGPQLRRGLVALGFALGLSSGLAASDAELAEPQLEPVQASYRKGTDPMRLSLPEAYLFSGTMQLALEVDAVDVSNMVSLENNGLVYQPPIPLSPGMHEVRLVGYAHNGDIIELGQWSIEVRQSALFQEQQLNVKASVQADYRVAEDYNGQDNDIDRSSASGGAQVSYAAANKGSKVNFTGDLIYNDREEYNQEDREVDLGEYLLQVELGENNQLALGHHAIEHSSLIYRNFHRRGVSGRFNIPSADSRVQLFSARAGDLQGFTGGGLGVEDSENRVSGLTLDYQPIANDNQQLSFSASYLAGKIKDEDGNLGLLVEESEGDAASLAVDAQLLERTLRIRGEAAQSQFAYDGGGEGFDKTRDSAYQLFAVYAPQPADSEFPFIWDLSLEKTIVNPDFYSLANTKLVPDKDLSKATLNLNKAEWAGQLFLSYEEDNLDDRFSDTNKITQVGTWLSYAFMEPKGIWGTPQYSLNIIQTNNSPETTNNLVVGDTATQYLELLGQFNYLKGDWSVLLTEDKYQDDLNPFYDEVSVTYGLDGSYRLSEQNILSAGISSLKTTNDSSNLEDSSTQYQLGFDYALPMYTLWGSIKLHYTEEALEIEDDQVWHNTVLDASITKQLREARQLFPGINLGLSGIYQDQDNQGDNSLDSDTYEVFMSLNFYWDVNRPQTLGGSQ